MYGGVSIPVSLGLGGFQQQVGVATRALQGVGLAGGTASSRVAQVAIAAKQFVNLAVPASIFASQIAQSVFGMTQLSTKIAGVANFFAANYFPLPFLSPINQGILQTVVFLRQAGTINSVISSAITGFTNLGFSGKLAFSTILTGGLAAAPQAMAFLLNQSALVNQVFVTGLIPNIMTVNALMMTYQSLFATALANPVRYTDLVVLGGILKELVPKASLLGQTLNTMITPIKFGRAAQGFIAYLNLLGTEVTALTMQVNTLTTGLAASAASLIGGGSFLLPGQLSPGPTVVDMFQNQQGVEEAVQYQILTDNLRALSETSGATATQIDNVNRAIFSIGTSTKQNIDQVANSASALKRAGVDVEELPAALKSLGYAASATNEDMMALGKTTLDLTSAFTGLTIPEAADVLTAISTQTGVATNQLATSIVSASGIAKSAGLNFKETALLIGSLGAAGISGANASGTLEAAITSLQGIAGDYNKNTKSNGVSALSALGLSKSDIVDASGNVNNIESIIQSFQGRIAEFNNAGKQSQVAPLISQVFGSQSANEMLALFNQSSSAINSLKQSINNAGGVSQKVSDSQMTSLAGTLDRLTDGARAVSITVGQFLSPILSSFLQPVAALTEGFLKLPPALQLTALSLSVVGPLALVVFQGTKLLVTWTKLWAAAQIAAGVAADIFTGKLTALQVKQAIAVQWTEITTKVTQAYSFALGVLTGQISATEAKQAILNASQAFGAANSREFFNTTKASIAILGDYAKHLIIGTTNIRLFSISQLASAAATGIKNTIINTAIALTKAQTYVDLAQNAVTLTQIGINKIVSGSIAAKTFVLGLFTRQQATANTQQSLSTTISLIAAQAKNIYAIAVGRASAATLGFIGTMATLAVRFALLTAAAWAVSQAWNSFSVGVKEANGIKETADNINKLTTELTGLQAKANDSGNAFQQFWESVQKKGPIEATQQALSTVTGGSSADIYGKDFSVITGSQLAAQRAMFATEEVSKAVNTQLELGVGVMQKYGIETLDAADKQRLGAQGIADFKVEATRQVDTLNKTLEALKAQKPVNDEQKVFLQTNIKLTEQQIRILRGKIVALESETATTKIHILTLDELTKKYKEVAYASEMATQKSLASIEERVAKGKGRGGIDQERGDELKLGLEKVGVTERTRTNASQLKDLKAASVGAKPEDTAKIAEEIKRIELDQVKTRIDAAKLEQQARKNLNDDILGNVKEREDAVTAKQQLSSQNQITAIKKAQAARTYSAEEAAAKIAAIESADLQASIAHETEKQQKLNQLRQWGVISEEEARKGMRESVGEVAKIQGQIAEAGLKKTEEQAAAQLKSIKDREDSLTTAQELSSQTQITAIKKAQAAKVYSAEEAAAKIGAIETADLQASLNREVQKQQNINQLRQRGLISEEEARKGLGESAIAIAKTQGQLAEAEVKRSEERVAARVKAIEEQAKFAKLRPEQELAKLDAKSFASDQQGKLTTAQSGVGDARSELDKQRLGFALQLAELNNNQSQQEQIKNQIYQQQLASLTQQQEAKRQELVLSQQQQSIELERKRIQSELAVLEAQSALQIAQAQGASAAEIAALQQSVSLKQQIVAQVATEQANQGKLNSLSSEQLAIQQQTAKEGLEQQRQIDLEREAIEKKTKAIEEGLNRARALSEARSQGLEFKGQDIGAEINKQKLLADISQSQSNLQKQRLEFSLQTAELTGQESTKEQLKQQIYQQQQASLIAQHQAQKTSLQLSNQQAAIELERKRIQGEIALLEAQANLESAQAKNASAAEISSLQAVIALRQKSVDYISTEEANQNKINQLTSQHLTLEQQIAREGLEQQRQLETQKLAIEKRTKAIEDGLIRSRTAMEGQSQSLEFKGQNVGGEIDKQKGVTDLQQSQAALQKQQLDFALQRAELTGNESAKEQIKEQIYQQQKAALVAQQQAQIVGIGLSRQQAAIELERQKLSAQIAVTEAQANLAKAQITKTTSAAEMESLRATVGFRQQALGQITAQAAVSKQVQSTEDQKLAIERQTTMENLVQTRELERQKEAIEKQKQAIEERLQAQKSGLENRQGKLELSNQLLDLESRQLSARSGLAEATNGLEQQRLEFLMSQAEITGNTAQQESLKTQLYQQQLAAIDRSHQVQWQSFEISQKQKQIELDRQEIQAKIAAFEAEANIAKAKADNSSPQQISALESVYKLRQEALGQLGQMRTAERQIANLEQQKLNTEQLSAREKLRQTNQLEKMKQAYDANNKALEKKKELEKPEPINTSGGITWMDQAESPWFENAKNPFQETAENFFAASIPPDLAPIAPDALKTDPLLTGKTPDTAQQLANMQVTAQNVYLTGTVAEAQKPADWLSQTLADISAPVAQSQPMDTTAQREAAKAKIEQARSALSAALARQNAETVNIDPAEAARQGLDAAASARDFAAQIRADLKSGVLKNQVTGRTVSLNLPPTLAELASNVAKAEAALKEIKDPVTLDSIYKSMEEIKGILKNLPTGNLTVVSQNPVAECGEILSALTRRR
ncbi:hypothetical protein [Microcoleus sp. B3-D7]|uniref:hypothetical protein n=1 Tax=Microcoleus sp. B3-D7 TaxID=2818659 RepID=UPI002FD3B5D5